MAAPMHSVFVGAETGLLKGIGLKRSQWNNLNSLECADKQNEICSMCWGNSHQTEICFGSRNRRIHVYDIETGNIQVDPCTFEGGEGRFRGLAKIDGNYLTAVESGLVKLWKDDNCVEITAGKDLCCMAQNPHEQNIIATGGKENCLKIWDLQRPGEPIFKAKNMKNDWLNLRVPVWVMNAQFIPGSGTVATSTGHHKVRVYDTKSDQRRPVVDIDIDEYPLTAMSLRHDNDVQIVVGNTQGRMSLIDLRNAKLVQIYKGFAGGIRDIACHPTKPLVASCGLDRHLRIHHIDTKDMIHKLYLKSRLNCVLFSSKEEKVADEMKQKKLVSENKEEDRESGIESSDEEDVWDSLEVVETVKKSLSSVEKIPEPGTRSDKRRNSLKNTQDKKKQKKK